MNNTRSIVVALAIVSAFALTGCSDGGTQELRVWMDEVKREAPVSVKKLPEPKKFAPFVYAADSELDPYDPMKLTVALDKLAASSGNGIKPDLDRRREPLENHPLDTVTMVGTMQKPGLNYALLQIDRSIFHVKVGNYIGQNFGMVTRITDTEVELKEIVRDASGEWVERMAKLELQENKK
jgi:type IV pilus assembly protein PilP